MKSIARVADKSIPFNQIILKLNNVIIQRLNSPNRGRSNKPNSQTTDLDAITSNTSINTISKSDLQRYCLGVNNMEILEKMVSGGGRILGIIKPTTEYDIPTTSSTALRARTEMTTEEPDSNLATVQCSAQLRYSTQIFNSDQFKQFRYGFSAL